MSVFQQPPGPTDVAGTAFAAWQVGVYMKNTRFRLVFEGLYQSAQPQKIVAYFQKALGLSQDAILHLLSNPPRVLWEVSIKNDAELINDSLSKMGCRTYSEPIITDSYPFAISAKHHKLMNQELSKILRVKANLALFLVQVSAPETGSIPPSMMGPTRDKFEECFRESDTVIGIDDSRLVILGFSTDGEGVQHVEAKANRVLRELLGDKTNITTGSSLFPQEAQNLPGLLHLAERNRSGDESVELVEAHAPAPEEKALPHTLTGGEGKQEALQRCFTEARGQIFQRLCGLDPQILWLGLSRLDEIEQREFLTRLPFDSPLCPVLEEMIDSRCDTTASEADGYHFEAIIHQMELEEGLHERKEMRQEVLSKLNRAEALPTLPSIAAHVFKIASNPESSAEDITRIIVNDPPLTSKLLKIVNSAFYGFPQKVVSVKQAVVILGTQEIMDLAFGLAAAKVFQIKPVEGLSDPRALWHHSMGTALIAQDLCLKLPQCQTFGAFTAGLLHDFGKIFLMDNFSEFYGQLYADSARRGLPIFELEEDRLGLNHSVIGKALASNWNLPDSLVEAVAFHHRPSSAPNHSQLAAIVGLADYLDYQVIMAKKQPDEPHFLSPPITYGHSSTLMELYQDLNAEALETMTENAIAIIDKNQDLFAILD
jgi:HD-like signal output (HDOD) protein